MRRWIAPLVMLLCVGCPQAPELEPEPMEPSLPEPADPWGPGPYGAGHVTLTWERPERTVTVEVWYPTEAAATPASVLTFEPEGEREGLEMLVLGAPEGCVTQNTNATRGAAPWAALGPRPLIAYSHCLGCGRYSAFSIAERLASHGFIIVAPDHAGPRPFLGDGEALSPAQLQTRVADMRGVLDVALSGELFSGLAGLEADADAVGVMGHSFGSATTGFVAHNDPRVKAAAGLAAPMANPLFRGATMQGIEVPVMLILAQEDNSIGELGNDLMRENFEDANPPVWRVDMADAGHWSVSDIAGLTSSFQPGCGEGVRHSVDRAGESFTYLPVAQGIEQTATLLTAFFLGHLTDHPNPRLDALPETPGVTIERR